MIDEMKTFLKTREKMNLCLVISNLLVFLVLRCIGDPRSAAFMLQHGACYTPAILQGEYYRLFSSMFLHFSLQHLLYNMLCLITMGDMLETIIGPWRYLLIYVLGGLGGNVLSLILEIQGIGRKAADSYAVSAGASGAVFAVIGAIFLIILKNRKRGRTGTISAKRMGFVVILMVVEGFMEQGVDNAAHIGGLAAGFLLAWLVYRSKKNNF